MESTPFGLSLFPCVTNTIWKKLLLDEAKSHPLFLSL